MLVLSAVSTKSSHTLKGNTKRMGNDKKGGARGRGPFEVRAQAKVITCAMVMFRFNHPIGSAKHTYSTVQYSAVCSLKAGNVEYRVQTVLGA